MYSTRSALLLAGLMCCGLSANAAPVLWTLQDVNFDDGGSGTGSFVFDVDTGEFSGISIVTTPGSEFDGLTYVASVSFGFDPARNLFAFEAPPADPDDLTGLSFFSLSYAPLTNAGGISIISHARELECTGPTCGGIRVNREVFATGTLVGSAVPVPGAVWLFASAIGALGWARRRCDDD